MELRLWSQATSWQEFVVFNTTWFTWSYMPATFSAKSLIIIHIFFATALPYWVEQHGGVFPSGERAALLDAAEFEGKNRQDCKASLGSWYWCLEIQTKTLSGRLRWGWWGPRWWCLFLSAWKASAGGLEILSTRCGRRRKDDGCSKGKRYS